MDVSKSGYFPPGFGVLPFFPRPGDDHGCGLSVLFILGMGEFHVFFHHRYADKKEKERNQYRAGHDHPGKPCRNAEKEHPPPEEDLPHIIRMPGIVPEALSADFLFLFPCFQKPVQGDIRSCLKEQGGTDDDNADDVKRSEPAGPHGKGRIQGKTTEKHDNRGKQMDSQETGHPVHPA